MPTTYAYKVRDREGKMAAGSMEAESEEAVVSRLRQLGYAPISIEAEKGAGLKTEVKLPGAGRVKLKDLAVFSRQFATMINSGLSLLRSLTILGEQTSNRRLGEVIIQVRAEVEKGTSLSAALARHPNVACKVSGLVTEADWTAWTPAQLAPYVAHAAEVFGPERLLFGSDWPVCLLAAATTSA